jgi:predicted dehydrogenase
VKQLIDNGLLGKISTVQIRFAIPPYKEDYNRETLPWRVKKDIAGAGYFYDLASHQLDLLDYLFGEITDVYGFTNNVAGLYEVEDSLTAAFCFKSGVTGSGSWSFVAPENSRTDLIDITGTKGRLTFATFDFPPNLMDTAAGIQEFREENPENIQYFLVESIVNYLNGRGVEPVSTGISATRANWVMDKILGKTT